MRRRLFRFVDRWVCCQFCWWWCRQDGEALAESWRCARRCRHRNLEAVR